MKSREAELTLEWEATIAEVVKTCIVLPEERRDSHESNLPETAPRTILVCGAKGLGKSTFLRVLASKILSQCAQCNVSYLDTDVGQCEFTPPGLISLHELKESESVFSDGDTATTAELSGYHEPLESRFLGDTTPKVHPTIYVDKVKELISFHEKRETNQPLLVNTHGWVVGMGADLVKSIVEICKPDAIVHLVRDGQPDEMYFDVIKNRKEFRIFPGTDNANPESPDMLRYHRLCRYFLRKTENVNKLTFGNWLANTSPYCIRSDMLTLVDVTENKLSARNPEIMVAFNGAVVGLISSAKSDRCLGLGIVRSIGYSENESGW
eukprot:CAMPEP_0184056668 /NCGR_PEP_ID=MMETSP0956-20121227/7934_1 /TAXON_ID=627963 /ORGANISM="Aplanochytrium sp, Strain PBS07" /LENGTH=322 /DNA_ID=CAMNT_0026350777 /DNA_START=211 /DNA_END=1176 /DNA_ORIENTATION=+